MTEDLLEASGSSGILVSYSGDLLFFSYYDGGCTGQAIKWAGSNNDYTGIWFAPRGQVEFSGSTELIRGGAVLGHMVKLNGSGTFVADFVPSNPNLPLMGVLTQ